jgi:hypothetical protein
LLLQQQQQQGVLMDRSQKTPQHLSSAPRDQHLPMLCVDPPPFTHPANPGPTHSHKYNVPIRLVCHNNSICCLQPQTKLQHPTHCVGAVEAASPAAALTTKGGAVCPACFCLCCCSCCLTQKNTGR